MVHCTLKRFITASNENTDDSNFGHANVTIIKSIFTPVMENELAQHITALAHQFHGLTNTKCRQLAYEYGLRNDFVIPDNWRKEKKAGRLLATDMHW